MEIDAALGREWSTLQDNYEHYEGRGLLIKLAAVAVLLGGTVAGLGPGRVVAVLLVLWLQEGIFRTFQSRLGARLLQIEAMLAGASDRAGPAGPADPAGPGDPADPSGTSRQGFQLHTAWLAQRKGAAGLLREYATSAVRPTVAFPYPVLVLLALVF